VDFFGGPFHGELRFVGASDREVTLPVIHDDEHPQYGGFSGPQLYSIKFVNNLRNKRRAIYVGPSPNQDYGEE